MSSPVKPSLKLPPRRSSLPPEQTKPSKWIAVFWWIVFIVPVIFTYYATHSVIPAIILVALRIAVMYIPNPWAKKLEQKKETTPAAEPVKAKVNITHNPLTPYIEEAKAEWRWLMKFLHIYDHESEDKYLNTYRQLRGWK